MATLPTLIDTWFCDDIREEKNGHYSMMGVYPSKQVLVQQLPTVISQFNIIMRFTNLPEKPPALHIKITAPDGLDSRPVQGRLLSPVSTQGEGLFILCAAPMQLSHEGEHTIHIKIDEQSSNVTFDVKKIT